RSGHAEAVLEDLLAAAGDRRFDRDAGTAGVDPAVQGAAWRTERAARAQPIPVRQPGDRGGQAEGDAESRGQTVTRLTRRAARSEISTMTARPAFRQRRCRSFASTRRYDDRRALVPHRHDSKFDLIAA